MVNSSTASKLLQEFELSPQAIELNSRLTEIIKQKIRDKDGVIPFSDFMNMALYYPALGYYQNQRYKIGEEGDFITAPELGHYFAHSLANSMKDLFAADGWIESPNILEIGAGSGALAFDLLQRLAELDRLPCRYLILEPSAELQARQKQHLNQLSSELLERIDWISDLPADFCGMILANEVADAIPCERMTFHDNQWYQLGVAIDNQQFVEVTMKPINRQELPDFIQSREAESSSESDYQDGYQTEYRPMMEGWINRLSRCLKQGQILLIDYGYSESDLYHPQRYQGSLKCFIQHHSHDDPYSLVGLQDITAHVDFSQIAKIAEQNNLNLDGFTTQAGFLLENGVTELSPATNRADDEQAIYRQSQHLQKLLLPGQMGEVIKAILLGKDTPASVSGFSLQDHRYKL